MSLPKPRIGPLEPVFPSDVSDVDESAAEAFSMMRHELNNHLTAALAEIQLLLMDVESEELRLSYEIIQESLRGMRTVVAGPKLAP